MEDIETWTRNVGAGKTHQRAEAHKAHHLRGTMFNHKAQHPPKDQVHLLLTPSVSHLLDSQIAQFYP